MACPSCAHPGKGVKRITLESLLVDAAQADDGFRHCPAAGCNVAYFHDDGRTIDKSQVRVAIGTKEGTGLLCYCFGHSYESIAAEPERDVVAEISAACQAGQDDCRQKNPQGSCCLGNIRQVVGAGESSCCSNADEGSVSTDKRGLLSALGAAAAAIMASACCWLPALLITFGASGSVAAGFFEEYRIVFLVMTAAFLGAGFYYLYFRKSVCESGSTCEISMLRRWGRAGLWAATIVVVGFAFLPNYIGRIEPVAVATSGTPHVFAVEGMTCEGCAHSIETALRKVVGVIGASVSYSEKTATAWTEAGTTDAALLAAIESVGYRARRQR